MGWESAGSKTIWRDSLCSESPGQPRLGVSWDRPQLGTCRPGFCRQASAGHELAQQRDSEESAQVREHTGRARGQAPGCERQEPVQPDSLPQDVYMRCFCLYLKGNLSLPTACEVGALHIHRDHLLNPHLGSQRGFGVQMVAVC